MTDRAVLLQPHRLHAATLRLRYFALLVVTSAVVGGIAGASRQLLAPALLLLWMPAYLLWVISDLRVRRVVGMAFVFQLIIALVPLWGLLLYLLWSRRLVGFAEWILFSAALWIPALLAGGLAHGIAQFARGERW
jgi:hypothetical protein